MAAKLQPKKPAAEEEEDEDKKDSDKVKKTGEHSHSVRKIHPYKPIK